MPTIIYLGVAAIALLLTGFYAGTETGVISANRVRIRFKAHHGDKNARLLERFLAEPDIFLSTVLIGTNIMITITSSLMTVYFKPIVSEWMIPLIETSIILVCGEVIPKSLYREFPNILSLRSVRGIQISTYIFYPLVKVTQFITTLILRIFKANTPDHDSTYSRQSIWHMIQEGRRIGVVEPEELEIITRVFTFRDIPIQQVMIPHTQITMVPDTISFDALKKVFADTGYSRIPVYHTDKHNIIGIVYFFDILNDEPPEDMEDLIKSVYFVAPNKRCDHLLEEFRKMQSHIAIIKENEHIIGLVSIEDLLERLVGKIYDEHDTH